MKRALILGINGMDGSYLADILLEKNYEVHGVVRRNSQPNLWRLQHCLDKITLHQGDVTDPLCLQDVISKILPEEIYNEADQDHVGFSIAAPKISVDVTYGAVASLLEILRGSRIKFFQPLSATMFGNAKAPQTLETPFDPQSPYAVAKVAAYYLCKHYREKYGVQVYTAILYNHDSVRRQGNYLLHDICKNAVKIKHGDEKYLPLTNLGKRVDIGWAKDYMNLAVDVMQGKPQDLLIGSTMAHTIYDLAQYALRRVGINCNLLAHIKDSVQTNQYPEETWLQSSYAIGLTKNVFDLIDELCNHYETQLYGANGVISSSRGAEKHG